MSRAVYGTATALLLIGAATFLYKTLFLEMPTRPDRDARVWRVEIAVTATGEGRL